MRYRFRCRDDPGENAEGLALSDRWTLQFPLQDGGTLTVLLGPDVARMLVQSIDLLRAQGQLPADTV